MKTKTQTVQESRRFDAVYDPLFTQSGQPQLSRSAYVDPRVKALPLHLRPPSRGRQVAEVSGRDRTSYFRRPVVAYHSSHQPDIVIQKAAPAPAPIRKTAVPKSTSIGIQSDFRDSSAQTDPYTPDYYVPPGHKPEILTLMNLTHQQGLPAGLREVEMIERARLKRKWEASLPPAESEKDFDARRKMLEDLDLAEWAHREKEINELQDQRIDMMRETMRKEMEKRDDEVAVKLQKIWTKKAEQKEAILANIQRKRIKALRKLGEQRKEVNLGPKKRDIVSDYANYGSKVYAPQPRAGGLSDKEFSLHHTKIEINTGQALAELERSLSSSVTSAKIKRPALKGSAQTPKERKERALAAQLDRVDKQLKEKRANKTSKPTGPDPLDKHLIKRPPPRPPTPNVDSADIAADKRQQAVLLLQRLLRGRAVQNAMFEGKEKRMDLLDEMRTLDLKADEVARATVVEEAVHQVRQKEIAVNAATEAVQGAAVSEALDYLSRELVRAREQRRLAAIVKLAERTRRMREAEERGRRAEEERRRKEADRLFVEVMGLHHVTVESYLNSIIAETIEEASETQAAEEAVAQADKLNSILDQAEVENSQRAPDEVVRTLVSSFLLPEVEKASLRQEVDSQQNALLLAARQSLQ